MTVELLVGGFVVKVGHHQAEKDPVLVGGFPHPTKGGGILGGMSSCPRERNRAGEVAEVPVRPGFIPGEEIDTQIVDPHVLKMFDMSFDVGFGPRAVDLDPPRIVRGIETRDFEVGAHDGGIGVAGIDIEPERVRIHS